MTASPSQIRLLVMVLIAWCALSAAPVVATSPALPAAFFVIGLGLVAAVTLRFSTLAGFGVAILGTVLFGLSVVSDQPALAGRGLLEGVATGIDRPQLILPVIMAAISLFGTAVCGWLASWGIEGRPGVIQAPGVEDARDVRLEPPPAVRAAAQTAARTETGAKPEAETAPEPEATGPREPAPAPVPGARGVEEPGGVRETAEVHESTGVHEATGVDESEPAEQPAPEEPVPLQAAPDKAPILVEESSEREREQREGAVDTTAMEAANTAGRSRRRPDSVRRPPRRRKR